MKARAIILVAGTSTRLRTLTQGRPKSFLEVGGETLIGRHVRLLHEHGVHDVTLVVGFESERFRRAFPGCAFVVNPSFSTTNTAVSLGLALHPREPGPVLVINGDVYYERDVLGALLRPCGRTLAAVQRHPLTDEEVKVCVEGTRITAIGKQLDPGLAFGEAFGVYRLEPPFAAALGAALARHRDPHAFYEIAMDRVIREGQRMDLHDVGSALVKEIDFPEDYAELLAAVG